MLARIHDLLEIDVERFLQAQVSAPTPEWVIESLRQTPVVVVRRGPISSHEIPIGVRGLHRNERWAAACHPSLVGETLAPQKLLARVATPGLPARAGDIPALQALSLLTERWKTLEFPWGPGGSVGFELATGRLTVTPQSDLDIVIYTDSPMSVAAATLLREAAEGLPAPVDIRVETPTCGFSLAEYASRSPAPILLRTASGAVLGTDPWG